VDGLLVFIYAVNWLLRPETNVFKFNSPRLLSNYCPSTVSCWLFSAEMLLVLQAEEGLMLPHKRRECSYSGLSLAVLLLNDPIPTQTQTFRFRSVLLCLLPRARDSQLLYLGFGASLFRLTDSTEVSEWPLCV